MWDIVEKLNPWPPIQYGLIAFIVFVSAYTYVRVLANKFPLQPPSAPQQGSGGTQEVSFLYFQGWFKGVLEDLSTLKNNQELNKHQMRETIGDELRKTRHELKSSMADVQAELKQDIEENNRQQLLAINNLATAVHDIRDRILQQGSKLR